MIIVQVKRAALARITVGAALLMALVGGVSSAAADPDHMALLVSGTATQHARQLVASTIDAVARERGLVLVAQSFTPKEVAKINECVTAPQAWTCIAPVVRGKGLQQVAVVTVGTDTSRDGSPMVVITQQILVASLDMTTGAQRFCVRCTDDVLVKSTTELTVSLLQEIAVNSGRTVVAISSTPRGARITFDGKSMGATDRSFNTFPGTHTVILELDGYQRETRSVDTAIDKTSELSIAMHPLVQAGPAGDPSVATGTPSRSTLGPKIAMTTGAVAIVAGGIALALDQKSETAPVGADQRRYYYDTTAPGIALIIGGAVTAAGGFLWWRYTKSPARPAVAPLTGGAVVGVATTF